MQIKVLGYSGSIGSGRHTTSFLIDNDMLIDAGTGVCTLSLDELIHIRHIFVTHSHLDHIAGLPLVINTIFHQIDAPVSVYSQAETLKALRENIFNWRIWPDFSVLPSADQPAIRFAELVPGEVLTLGERAICAVPVNHVVPAVGYRIESARGAFAFSGDTTTNDGFWTALNRHERLDLLFVEVTFADKDLEVARMAGHYCPRLLAADLPKMHHRPRIFITHARPGLEERVLRECRAQIFDLEVDRLAGGEVFRL